MSSVEFTIVTSRADNSYLCKYSNQGIIDSTGTETRQIVSHMFVMAKIFEKLFISTWNGIAVSV